MRHQYTSFKTIRLVTDLVISLPRSRYNQIISTVYMDQSEGRSYGHWIKFGPTSDLSSSICIKIRVYLMCMNLDEYPTVSLGIEPNFVRLRTTERCCLGPLGR